MTGSITIGRQSSDPDGLDFAALRNQAITSAQALAGKIWTDYNLHDPGVTILEQICFGLTELAYQTAMPVADLLANEKGQINYRELALLKPHEALPSSAVTPRDYCKLLIDQVPELERIEFIPRLKEATGYSGCYDVNIKILEPLTGAALTTEQIEAIKNKVRNIYAQHRNLCEDIGELSLVASSSCLLCGHIETDASRNPAEIYADVLFQAARKISSNITLKRYEEIVSQGQDLADIFSGPLTQHGVIESASFSTANTTKALEELTGVIAAIPGVKNVHKLHLCNAQGEKLSAEDLLQNSFHLRFPELKDPALSIDFNVGNLSAEVITKSNLKAHAKFLSDSLRHLQKLEFEYRAFRTNTANASNFYLLPEAQPRQELAYYSFQHHFPNVYGINERGLSAQADPSRKAQAQQLKAFLYPIDQLMANFLQLLQNLQQLFSLNHKHEYSYFAEFLDNVNIPRMQQLYTAEDTSLVDIAKVQARHDNYLSRKNRALDTLLALYGEEFLQQGLLKFNYYHQDSPGYWTIENKIHFLRHIAELSSRRSAAFNTHKNSWGPEGAGSWQRKIAILLGIKHYKRNDSLTATFTQNNLHWTSDKKSTDTSSTVTGKPLPRLAPSSAKRLNAWRYKSNKALSISPQLLIQGTHLDSYSLLEEGSAYSIYFHNPQSEQQLRLNSFDSREKAIEYAHKFKKIITDINADSEGLFLLEHLLLRPRAAVKPTGDDFYQHQVSIVLPNWSARFNNPSFRQYLQKIICQQLPAHLLAHFYWVDRLKMEAFEEKYQTWLQQLASFEQTHSNSQGENNQAASLNQAAQQLRLWLDQQQANQDYWV